MYAFITPIHIKSGDKMYIDFFKKTAESIINQSDSDWVWIIVDDFSNNEELDGIIANIAEKYSPKVIYSKNQSNLGPGISRNRGIEIANELGAKVIMYIDADDIAHLDRVKLTKEIFDNSDTGVLYSGFIPIDQNDDVICDDMLSYSIKDIIKADRENPPQGKDVWKIIGISTGYVNMTSSTSVRIDYALKIPFPGRRASEDAYTWMLYSAYGAKFSYTDKIPCLYRIPLNTEGSSSRSYVGKENFYKELANTNTEAFKKCIEYALSYESIKKDEAVTLLKLFYKRLADTLKGEGQTDLAEKYYQSAM